MKELLQQLIEEGYATFQYWNRRAGLPTHPWDGTEKGDMTLFGSMDPAVVASFGWSTRLAGLNVLLDLIESNEGNETITA